jgi:type VI secretion system protein ImpG
VQLKLDAEFPRFTQRLLEIVYPQFLTPTPSMLIARLQPELGDAALATGVTVPRGTVMTGRAGKGSTTACEFRTAHDVALWPLTLTRLEYFTHAADLPLASLPEWRRYRSGVRLRVKATAGLDFQRLTLNDLRLHLTGIDDIAYRLHELICGHALGVIVQPAVRADGRWQALDRDCIEPVGCEDDQALLPPTLGGFAGYRLLQEYFAFPQRFLFFDLAGIGDALRAVGGDEVDIVVLFSRAEPALQQAVDLNCIALHCVPAVNLLERRCDRIHVGPETADYHLVPDRARPMDFEVHTVLDVQGYGVGVDSQWHFLPFYSAFHAEDRAHDAYYAVQREPRLLSAVQQRDGPRTSYIGTEVYLTVVDGRETPFSGDLRQLGVRALCTNRDLPVLLPVGQSGGDLTLSVTAPVREVMVIKGPSRPVSALREGSVAWKLINQLSLNHLSLIDTDREQGAAALRQILRLYAPAGDSAAQRQIEGLRNVAMKPVVRRLPMAGPITFGRGVAIDVEVDDLSFEGGSAFLLGTVLERFVARHVSINGFTQLRVASPLRGDIFTGQPRCGARPLL